MTEMPSACVNVMHRSFCYSFWNTTVSKFLTLYVYFRFYYRKPQYHFFRTTVRILNVFFFDLMTLFDKVMFLILRVQIQKRKIWDKPFVERLILHA